MDDKKLVESIAFETLLQAIKNCSEETQEEVSAAYGKLIEEALRT